MGGYHQYVVNGEIAWARDDDEIRARYGPSVQFSEVQGGVAPAAATWDVYLVGHGYTLENYVPAAWHGPIPQQQAFTVPQGITVIFYTAVGGYFDSKDQAPILAGNVHNQVPVVPVVETWPAGSAGRFQHVLLFPSVKIDPLKLHQMVHIIKVGYHPLNPKDGPTHPDTAKLVLAKNPPFQNRVPMYVGYPKQQGGGAAYNLRNHCLGNYACLSDILDLIRGKHTPTRVHWLACRAGYPGDEGFWGQCRAPVNAAGEVPEVDTAVLQAWSR
ncbi:MAG: putative adhesin [Bryobacteraceae bacterium]